MTISKLAVRCAPPMTVAGCLAATLLLTLLGTIGNAPAARAAEGVSFHLSAAGGFEWLGYQEHLDPNGPDSVLARCTVNGRPSTCYIDSDAAVRNILLDLRGRADLGEGLLFGGAARIELSTGSGREQWDLSVNDNGSKGQSQTFQTNDLTYRWYRFDLFGGYRIISMVRPIAGLRISRARQVRSSFDPQPSGLNEAIEDIDSNWFLVGVIGEQEGPGVAIGYRFQAALPFSVTTTNSVIEGVEFTDVGGYSAEGAFSVAVPVAEQARLRFEVEGGAMHWDGSAIESVGQDGIAKWPENDTQFFIATAGIEFVL